MQAEKCELVRLPREGGAFVFFSGLTTFCHSVQVHFHCSQNFQRSDFFSVYPCTLASDDHEYEEQFELLQAEFAAQ